MGIAPKSNNDILPIPDDFESQYHGECYLRDLKDHGDGLIHHIVFRLVLGPDSWQWVLSD